MFRVYIDESGTDPSEPTLVVAALVGRTEEWERFDEEWLQALEAANPKPLAFYQGERYFKHSEARACQGCFAGFSDNQAEEKTVNLASVITRYDVSAYDLTLAHEMYLRLIDEMIVRKDGKYYNEHVKDPLCISLTLLAQLVLQDQYASNPNDKVDFIFDSGEMSDRVISMFKFMREEFSDLIPPIMGTLIAMDDKKVMPLQAVDLLAGQSRMTAQYQNKVLFKPTALLRQMDKYSAQFIGEPHIRLFLTTANISISTRRLKEMKGRGEREKEK
jgi:hypothetical protein